MLSNTSLLGGFWAKAMKTTVKMINRSPNKSLDGGILEEAWTGKKPSYSHLHIFGCEACAHVPKELWKKLDPKSNKCIFLGYGERWAIVPKI